MYSGSMNKTFIILETTLAGESEKTIALGIIHSEDVADRLVTALARSNAIDRREAVSAVPVRVYESVPLFGMIA